MLRYLMFKVCRLLLWCHRRLLDLHMCTAGDAPHCHGGAVPAPEVHDRVLMSTWNVKREGAAHAD